MRKRTLLERLFRAWLDLPAWLRPGVASGAIVLTIMIPRVAYALLFVAHKSPLGELFLALGAASGAAFLAGSTYGLARPHLRKLGRAGDYLSGVVMMYAYLGALMAASPWAFEHSAIPEDAKGIALWFGMATVLGLVAGHAWFAGPEGIERLAEQRSQPRIQALVATHGDGRASLVSGWVRARDLAAVLEELARATGVCLQAGESVRLATALSALQTKIENDGEDDVRNDVENDDEEQALEWLLPNTPPIPVCLAPEGELVSVDVLLEQAHERHVTAVRGVLATRTVDPLAA